MQSLEKEPNITYTMAKKDGQKNLELRQQYLDGINLGQMRKAIKHIVYDPTPQPIGRLAPKTQMAISPNFGARWGIPGFRSVVRVTPSAFGVPTEQDFLSMLLVHEGQHAEDIKERPQQVFIPWWRSLLLKVFGKTEPESESAAEVLNRRLNALSERRADHAQLIAHVSGERPLSEREYKDVLFHQFRNRFESHLLRDKRLAQGAKPESGT